MVINRRSALITLVLFCCELVIATVFANTNVIRGSLGDILVVILLYHLVLTCVDLPPIPLAVAILAFAILVEGAQYIGLADRLGFARGSIPSILIGTTFSWEDILMYTIGALLAVVSDPRT
jgi:hypothetical protein